MLFEVHLPYLDGLILNAVDMFVMTPVSFQVLYWIVGLSELLILPDLDLALLVGFAALLLSLLLVGSELFLRIL